ncbi:SCO family protein [Bacillus testis]|uniref:SCO family protein n=1 Tax=Bacillus testis TaxID=1622072 RepID=UPI00067E88DE|nr:SCO family protein [Bacillus testis]
MKKLYIIFTLLLVAGIGSGIYYFTEYRQSKMEFPKDAVLQTQWGDPYTYRHLTPKVRLIEFMYTQCPDICPNTTFQMKQLRDRLEKEGVFGSKVEFLTVSFDPDRDTKEVLDRYAQTFEINKSKGWYLLSGEKKDVQSLADHLNFQYRDPGTGQFVHSSATYLLDANNRVIEVFGMGEKDFNQKKVYKKIMRAI